MQKIAVIGISCLFPGAKNPDEFIQNLNNGADCTSPHTKKQMGVDPRLYYDKQKGLPDKYYSKRGGYITDFDFNPSGYLIAEDTLNRLDDVYKWSLYVAREALINGGYYNQPASLKSCGLVLGNLSFPTKESNKLFLPIYRRAFETGVKELLNLEDFKLAEENTSGNADYINSRISGYPPTLISKALGLSGPRFALDAACASSLYAVKFACDYLNAKRADLMLAGAVSAGDPFFVNQGFSTFTAYSPNDISCPLDKHSEGLVSGEGAGMFLLKRYEDAKKDNDHILAVISGIGLSNDGRGRSVLSPNTKGQLIAYERTYEKTNIRPDQIAYVECHATGTIVGDVVEIDSLESFFGKHHTLPMIGSVKSNFGHLLTCAGMASMMKVILSMNQPEIPATIHIKTPVDSRCDVVTTAKPWPSSPTGVAAAVNAFGFGGTNAHLVFEQDSPDVLSARPLSKPDDEQCDMTIIGMDACFGSDKTLQEFDQSNYQGKQHFVDLPEQRWKGLENFRSILQQYGFDSGTAPKGAYVEDFEFDAPQFKIPPNEVEKMIPQQLLMLKVADNALRDAGLREGGNVGVIIAMESDKSLHQFRGRIDLDWMLENALKKQTPPLTDSQLEALKKILKDAIRTPVQVNEFTSFIGNIMATRISALWDFSGPAFTLAAEESSVYKALDVARMMLSKDEVDAVVVGAVDLSGNFEDVLIRQQLLRSVNSGRYTMSFDNETNGWMVGEGAGAVVLKRSDIAKRDHDRGYAVINAINFTVGTDAASLFRNCSEAFSSAGIQAGDIGYLETSGAFGNEAEEINGLIESYSTAPRFHCALGSAAANFGHTFAASGMTSLIRTALCLHHQYIPGVPGWQAPKSGNWEKSAFYVATESRSWITAESSRRIAAINGKDSDGAFAHVILTEFPLPQQRENSHVSDSTPFAFPLTSDTENGLIDQLKILGQRLTNANNLYLLACENYTRFSETDKKKKIITILGNNAEQIKKEIDSALAFLKGANQPNPDWQSPLGSYYTRNPLGVSGKTAFVYPGAFNSYLGMGKDLFRLAPLLSDLIPTYTNCPDELFCSSLIFPRSMRSLSSADVEQAQDRLERSAIPTFESGINLAILNTALLQSAFEIQPDIAFGYSMGEISMAFALGLWENTNEMHAVLNSDSLFRERLAGPMLTAREAWDLPLDEKVANRNDIWSAYIVKQNIDQVIKALDDEERVFLLLIDTPDEIIIGGEKEACRQFIAGQGIEAIPAILHDVIHCELVRKEYDRIYQLHHSPVRKLSQIAFYSAADYQQLTPSSNTLADNIAQVYCKTLDFPRLVNKVYEDGARVFVEVGPRNKCSQWIADILNDQEHLAVSIDNKATSSYTALLRALTKLICHGVPVNLSTLYSPGILEKSRERNRIKSIKVGGDSSYKTILRQENRDYFTKKEEISSHIRNQEEPKQVARVQPLTETGDEESNQTAVNQYREQFNRSHGAFLNARKASLDQLREMIKLQIMVTSKKTSATVQSQSSIAENQPATFKGDPYFYPEVRKPVTTGQVIWNEDDLLEFAGGDIAKVFGEEYAVIDSYKYRVRLPLPPYLLVNRVVEINAGRGEFRPSSLVTEYDIPQNAWYSVDGQIPWAIASEAGQCDLLLISYLGIDFQSKGYRYYRLTDYTMTFFDHLPKEGDTLRYEIKIESFLKFGESLLFDFGYNCYVKDKLVYQMTGGRAGFTTDEELAQGKGIVLSKEEKRQRSMASKKTFMPLLTCPRTRFSRSDLRKITQGRIADCFGPLYDQPGRNPSLRFAAEEILMIDRIVSIDKNGGPWGLGEILAEKDLAPDHWYFPCHFKDDNVLAGTLVTEGCVQLLGFYMLYFGLQTKTKDARFQPIKNRPYVIRARGQIVPTDTRYSYKMEIIDIGTEPHPYARANFYILMNDKILVDFRDLGIEMVEKTSDDPSGTYVKPDDAAQPIQPLYDFDAIREFAVGDLEKVFGTEFSIYKNKKGPRIPNGDLLLMSRVLDLKGKRSDFREVSEIITEFDVPANAWYFESNSVPIAPYSIIMEMALQPSAFLSTYMGTPLLYPEAEMCYRNLSSDADLIHIPDLRGKTVKNRTRMLNVAKAAETVVINFEYDLSCDGSTFYKGVTQFGYFTPQALDMQKGLDRGEKIPPWFTRKNLALDSAYAFDLHAPETRERYYKINADRPCYRLAAGQLEFLDKVYLFPGSGTYGKGYIFATKAVDPSDWFYPCHFFGDPVMPGSLGVEAILQAMKLFSLQQDLGRELISPYFSHLPGTTKWIYRGQITPDTQTMDLEVHIKQILKGPEQIIVIADASLWKNKLRIDQVTDAAIVLKGETP